VSNDAGTQSRESSTEQVTREGPDPSIVEPVTRLLDSDGERFPYTEIRDWIGLLDPRVLADGPFRLYVISRSVICENAKDDTPARRVVEISYEEYAEILGRCARTISRYAQDLFAVGLWEEVERGARSVRVPGAARPQVQTVLSIRVHDRPRDLTAFDGPVKTQDVLSRIREARQRRALPDTDGAGRCDMTQQSGHTPPSAPPATPQPGQTRQSPGRSEGTPPSPPLTDMSATGVSAGHPVCEEAPEKVSDEEQPSPPAASSRAEQPAVSDPDMPGTGAADTDTADSLADELADELAMFSGEAVHVVRQLYAKTVGLPGTQPLSAEERAGLARRIDSRLSEGWSLSRIHAVLTGGSLVGVRMPGRLWASRLDDMPPYLARLPADDGRDTAPARTQPPAAPPPRRTGPPRGSRVPDPNEGKTRYEVPDARGRMAARWRDAHSTAPWCGRCAPDARTLRPRAPGELPRPCGVCHPEPDAFPGSDAERPSAGPACPPEPAATANSHTS
jgi:hypothetical protein